MVEGPQQQDQALFIRPLSEEDQDAVVAIYNHYVQHSHCTFDVTPFSRASRKPWFDLFENPLYQCMVASRDGEIAGYACSVPFKEKPAYRTSVEVSIYTAPQAGARGIGTQLYTALFDYLQSQPVHRAYAGIALPNEASVALHEKFAFTKAAHFHEVGYKFNRFWDVAWFEKPLAT